MGQSASVLQNTISFGPQLAAHSTAPLIGPVLASPPVTPARPKPQHFGAIGSLQSVGDVQSTGMLPVLHMEPHMVEKSVVLVQQC